MGGSWETMRKRVAALPTVDLASYAEEAMSSTYRCLGEFSKDPQEGWLLEGLDGLTIARYIIEELRNRTVN